MARTLSIQVMIALSVAFALLALILATAAALWGFAAAERQINRASQSYSQLALATRLDAEIGRLLVSEIAKIADPDAVIRSDPDPILATIDQLIAQIGEEIAMLDGDEEREIEREEFKTAYAVRALFSNMLHGIDRHRSRISSFGSGQSVRVFVNEVVTHDYGQLDRIVKSVVADERTEVRETLDDLASLRGRMVTVASVALITAAAIAIALAAMFYRSLMRPLEALSAGAEALSAGALDHRIPTSGPPELAKLALSFNDMADHLVTKQSALKRANESLEATVAERTRELEEKATRLTEIDASRRLFFAKIGHELRTPLSVLLGEAELGLSARSATIERHEQTLRRILIDGRFLQRRIDDLLALARSEDGRITLTREPIDLRDVVAGAEQIVNSYAQQNDVRLGLSLPADPVPAEADPEWLRQGILALVDNAIKYAVEKGHVEIELTRDADSARISVRDNGPGVDGDEIPNLFAPFSRSKAATNGRHGGTGLGLAVAKWVSVGHGGEISASNVKEGGFCVSICIPLNGFREEKAIK